MACFSAGGKKEREHLIPLHIGSDRKGAGLFQLLSQPWLSMRQQSPKREDQHLSRHIWTPRWEIHPPLHSIVSSSLLGLG